MPTTLSSQEEQDKSKEIQKNLTGTEESVKSISEEGEKIKDTLEDIQETVEEIEDSWKGSRDDLLSVSAMLKDILSDTSKFASLRKGSVSLSQRLSTEAERQAAIQATGDNITRRSIDARKVAVERYANSLKTSLAAYSEAVRSIGRPGYAVSAGDIAALNYDLSSAARSMENMARFSNDIDRANKLKDLSATAKTLNAAKEAIDALLKSLEKLNKSFDLLTSTKGRENSWLDLASKFASKLGMGDLAGMISSSKQDAISAFHTTYLETGNEKKAVAAYEEKIHGIRTKIVDKLKSSVFWIGIGVDLTVKIWKALLNIDEELVKAKRVTGQWLDAVAVGQTHLVSGQEVLKTIVALSEQFAFNAASVFTPDELARIAEVQKLTGMTAEAAGNLAVQSKINGVNVDQYRKSITAGRNQANLLNHSAVTLHAVQNEVLSTSNAIRLSYGKNVEGLARAAGAAKALGMSLQDVENIAKNLMNFESSIESEMQAQLLTGRQLNLAKAREYALNNDLEGVAKEIGRQGIDAASFSRMNYIQQEATAKALGMSREEMSKMLILQMLNSGLSAKQVAAATHMKEEDIEALSVQEKWQTMKQKFLTALVPLLEPILQFVSRILNGVSWLMGGLSWIITWGGKAPVAVRYIMAAILVGTGLVIRSWIRGRGILASMNGLALKLAKSLQLAFTGSWFDRGVGRWRNAAGRFTTAPKLFGGAAGAAANAGTANAAGAGASKLSGAFSKIGKNMNGILKGAAAIAIIATALVIFAYALKLMPKGEEGWQALKMAMLGLLGLAASMIVLGAVVHFAGEFILAGAAAMLLMAGALVVLGAAMLILAKVDWSAFDGVTKAAWQLAAAAPGFVIAGFLLFNAAGPLLIGSTALFLASIPLRGAFKNITAVSGEVLSSVALGIKDIAVAVGELAGKLSNLPVNKMNALGRLLRRAGKSGLVVSTGESAGMTRGTLSDTASVSAVSSVNTQAGEQQSSVSKVDLTEISNKMDRVIRAILSCKPTDWNWVEFHREYISNVPDASRR